MKNITMKWVLFFPHLYSYYYVEDSRAKGESDQARKNRLLGTKGGGRK